MLAEERSTSMLLREREGGRKEKYTFTQEEDEVRATEVPCVDCAGLRMAAQVS